MTTFSELIEIEPAPSDGHPMGWLADPDGRFVVQIATAGAGSVLGDPLPLILSSLQWQDVTDDVRGLKIERGGDAGQRADTGRLDLQLANQDRQYSPLVSTYYGPGSLVRVWARGSQFVGITKAWNEETDGLRQDRWVDITAWEPIFLLKAINNPALSPIGAGETFAFRVNRIFTAANLQTPWVYGGTATATFQATTLAQDLLTELDLVVDSVDGHVYPTKGGEIMAVAPREYGFKLWTLDGDDTDGVPCDADSLVTANDEDQLLSAVSLARAGGSAYTYTNSGISGRYQSRTTKRTDLITQSDADLDDVAAGMLARGRQTYRPVSIDLTAHGGNPDCDQVFECLVAIELNDLIDVAGDGVLFTDYRICRVEHAIELLNPSAGIVWRSTLHFDVTEESDFTPLEP